MIQASRVLADDLPDFDCQANFIPLKPALVLEYEVTFRLFGLNLIHLADARVHATDGEWFNEAKGEWARSYLMTFRLDTLEKPNRIGKGRYSIHNRLGTVLQKPTLEPLVFVKRDFMHVDTFFSSIEVHNTEFFSVESGHYDYLKKDFIASSSTTNLPQYAQLASQRNEVLKFMKNIFTVYAAGGTNTTLASNDFVFYVYTDNTLVPFNVSIASKLRQVEMLDKDFNAVYFKARPVPAAGGRGRNFEAWVAPFRYVAETVNDPGLIWMSINTFEWGMIPLMSEFGLKLGTVRCSLTKMELAADYE